jgi:hypothetical protein
MRLYLGTFRTACILLVASISLIFASELAAQESTAEDDSRSAITFTDLVQPLFKKYCFKCHGPHEQESDLRLDDLDPDMVKGRHGGQWREVLDALNRGDMPPEDEVQPTADERETVLQWLSSELDRAARLRRSTGGRVTLRRLTRYEYNNTMRDLLGLDMDYCKELPPDTKGIDGYKNNGVYMGMSDLQLEEYYKAAKRGLAAAIVQGDPIKPIHQRVTQAPKGVRFDDLVTAAFDESLGGTVVGYSLKDPKKKKSATKKNAMVLLCLDKLPLTGTFRVRIEASATEGDLEYSPPRMRVEIGHKTGVKIEPSKVLGNRDVTAKLGSPQTFEFSGRLEEFPLHTGMTVKKFPGLRVIITDDNAVIPKKPPKKKGQLAVEPIIANRPKLVIHSVEFETPVDQAWPPATHTRIFPTREPGTDEEAYVRFALENFISRAFRRPATKEEVNWALRYYATVRPTTSTVVDTMQEVLALVLVSPKFLYLPEYQPKKTGDQKVPLNDYELASRLSYFLLGTMPDQELLDLARQAKLHENKVLAEQIERMLSDKRSWQFVKGFAGQWLDLDGVDAVAVNPEFFPDFDNSLKEDMKQESLEFFAEILYEKHSCLNFLDSDFVVVNDRLAEFYGIEKPKSGEFKKVMLPADSVRGGVLTQASFLLANSTGAQSHPIYRAKWFLARIMGDPPGDPPADVPELYEESASAKKLTIRQQLEQHRKREACNRCHRKLDPWGIPFEGFNAIGHHFDSPSRAIRKAKPNHVADDTILPDGAEVKGSKQLLAYLLKNKKEMFAEGFCTHLLTYALGRSLEWTDQPLIDQLSSDFQAGGYVMDRLISDVVQSDAFKSK